jgi:hypothetical protein
MRAFAVAFFVVAMVFVAQYARANEMTDPNSPTCMKAADMVVILDTYTKANKVEAVAKYTNLNPENGVEYHVLYITFVGGDTFMSLFANTCLIKNPLSGLESTKIEVNDKVRALMQIGEILFDNRASF